MNQVLFVYLLMPSATALANQVIFKLTRCSLLTMAVSLSFAETIKEPGCSGEKAKIFSKFGKI